MRPEGVLVMAGVLRAVSLTVLAGFVFLPRVIGTLLFLVWPCAVGPAAETNKRKIMTIVSDFKVSLLKTTIEINCRYEFANRYIV
jgi:hypothetical protein